MRIEFVNHASFITEFNGVRLMSDPWLHGPAFNNGWDLISETVFKTEDFATIDYLWFSHEHPDHFSPPVLKAIPRELRQHVTVLYQECRDKKVLKFCEGLGFQTQELPSGRRVQLKGGLTVLCKSVPLFDSWLLMESDNRAVLNLNDTILRSPRALRSVQNLVGRPIDAMFSQFSYASWRGDESAVAQRRADAQRKLEIFKLHVSALKPRVAVPFASFSFFSHEENAFMSDSANKPWDVVEAVERAGQEAVLLYPGDRWEVGAKHDNAAAIERYRDDYAALSEHPRRSSEEVSMTSLVTSATKYIERVKSKNDALVMKLLKLTPLLRAFHPVDIYIWDLKKSVRFDFSSGLKEIASREKCYSLQMGSDSLDFLFKFAWGLDTLMVNGRFQADPAGLRRLLMTFGADVLNNSGIRVAPSLLVDVPTIAFLLKVLLSRLWAIRRSAA